MVNLVGHENPLVGPGGEGPRALLRVGEPLGVESPQVH